MGRKRKVLGRTAPCNKRGKRARQKARVRGGMQTQRNKAPRRARRRGSTRRRNRPSSVKIRHSLAACKSHATHTGAAPATFRILIYPEVPESFRCHQSERQFSAQERAGLRAGMRRSLRCDGRDDINQTLQGQNQRRFSRGNGGLERYASSRIMLIGTLQRDRKPAFIQPRNVLSLRRERRRVQKKLTIPGFYRG